MEERQITNIKYLVVKSFHHNVHNMTLLSPSLEPGMEEWEQRLEITSYPVDQKEISKGPVDQTEK